MIELQRAAAAPANPRSGNPLQIVTPSRTTIAAPGLTFVVYQRDLAARAPELVKVRIAARLSQSMNYDSRGRAVVTKPPVATWIIRDQGYDLRASSVRGSADMLVLRPVNTESSLPPGRYELLIDDQSYDFVVAGEVTDPAHCVEGLATVRGPAFYECKSL